jgi:uncharacterized membrane protein YphA (DoxX/SURF4 family)
MDLILKQGRYLFAAAIAAFGIENLVCARFPRDTVPVIPWVPGSPVLACFTGLALLAAAVSIASGVKSRVASILLGVLFLLCVVLLQVPRVAASPFDVGVRTGAFETLTMCGVALMLAGTMPVAAYPSRRWEIAENRLIRSGRYLFALSMVVFGIDHLFVIPLIVSLVPAWIPGSGLFWTYFTAFGFVAAGVCLAANWLARWAGLMLGVMFLLWFLLLHAPRVISYPRSHDPDEWSSAFIALGICGGSWIAAQAASARQAKRVARPELVSNQSAAHLS